MALLGDNRVGKRKIAAILAIMELTDEDEGVFKRGKTREWVHRREEKGLCNNIVREFSIEDTTAYKEMMRMSHEDFLRILGHIEHDITPHQVTGGNCVISPKIKTYSGHTIYGYGRNISIALFSVPNVTSCHLVYN